MQPTYRDRFFAVYGFGPYECAACHNEVTIDELFIHHRDEDRANGRTSNLEPMHVSCHCRHHAVHRIITTETRAKLRKANLGKVLSDETKRKIGVASRLVHTGRRRSVESRKRMSEAALRRHARRRLATVEQ